MCRGSTGLGCAGMRDRLEARYGLSLTVCGGFDRRSLIHIHRELLRPKSGSLVTNLLGTVVLNAEL